MTYQLLAGGYRDTLTLLTFNSSSATIKVESDSPVPPNASWLEPATESHGQGEGRVIYSLSEDDKKGMGLSLLLKDGKVEVTGQRETHGAPAHAIFFPVDSTGALSKNSESPLLEFPYPYKGQEAPNPERQEASHLHQIVEGNNGRLYAPDLGSDRIWVLEREGESGLGIKGWLQAPGGAGPRHVAISPDEKHLYCLTELSSEVLIFHLDDDLPSHPKPDFKVSIIPPNVPSTHSKKMDSAEIQLNPTIPNVLYASNRLELHIHESQPDLPPLESNNKGDAVAVILLGNDGTTVESVSHVRTEADGIRAMRVSPDGKYVALAGQQAGGVEIWRVDGKRGDQWRLAAKEESIKQITDIVWL